MGNKLPNRNACSKPYCGRTGEKAFSHDREATKTHKPKSSFCYVMFNARGFFGASPWCHEKEMSECFRIRCLMLIGYMEKQKM